MALSLLSAAPEWSGDSQGSWGLSTSLEHGLSQCHATRWGLGDCSVLS